MDGDCYLPRIAVATDPPLVHLAKDCVSAGCLAITAGRFACLHGFPPVQNLYPFPGAGRHEIVFDYPMRGRTAQTYATWEDAGHPIAASATVGARAMTMPRSCNPRIRKRVRTSPPFIRQTLLRRRPQHCRLCCKRSTSLSP